MGDPVGLARLPGDVSAALEACTAALIECAAAVDGVLASAHVAAPLEVEERRARSRQATGELLTAIGASRRPGPDRAKLAELARSADRTAEAVEAAVWSWVRHPVPELADVLRALRDATRAAAQAADALEDEDRRLVWDARCREREAEARFLARAARGELLVRQDDVRLAAAAQDVLTYAALWLTAVARLRESVLRCSFA